MSPQSDPFTIECARGVADVFSNVRNMVNEARDWVRLGEFVPVYGEKNIVSMRALWNELMTQVDAMEASWWRCVSSVVTMAGQTGQMKLSWDSDRSLLFIEPRTGLTGGIIPHFKHVNDQRTPICEWSCHT